MESIPRPSPLLAAASLACLGATLGEIVDLLERDYPDLGLREQGRAHVARQALAANDGYVDWCDLARPNAHDLQQAETIGDFVRLCARFDLAFHLEPGWICASRQIIGPSYADGYLARVLLANKPALADLLEGGEAYAGRPLIRPAEGEDAL